MRKRLTLKEILIELKEEVEAPKWNYTLSMDKWFFPSDVCPHSTKIKHICKKLYEAGLLERDGDGTNRWGYRYRINQLGIETLKSIENE